MAFVKPKLKQASDGNGVFRPVLAPGMYGARVLQVIDLGMQPGSPQFPDPKPKIEVVFELQDEFMVDKDGNPVEGVPAVFSTDYTYAEDGYITEKANLYKLYMAVNPDMDKSPDEFIGLPLDVMLTEKVRKSGKNAGEKYSAVTAVSPMKPKDVARATPLVGKPLYFDLSNPDLEVFNQLSKGNQYMQQDRIKASLKYGLSPLPALLGEPVAHPEPNPMQSHGYDEELPESFSGASGEGDSDDNLFE